ncbi:tripartite ATP-independent transporter DctM subunit [Rhodopseudomonas thermotolerans]|uniref:Tripartite ATP-independent transporter DctM subunit n=2 Tax=Rhodopseudomonas TaxID=1073 RepID=A0A336JXD3_9BRAD|nr:MULTISPECIES: TRAP transporter large permease subunit [Rhodopseudomonas]RED27283.1 tripartite ATP-independent transporter DctM subunit [Rhodopseudomonas pentothenatexigens]REF91092.1 tripartite ATP-independent transporter DctM subunit [Rhodopseudomonas thermotolerans]SSW92939.1 tripartite ATP-independent transporter DctM subunit [Rhodopseudomonas pentothenatexigens]
MTALLIHYMAPIMFASLVVFLLLGYPVAFSLAANGLMFAFLGIELGLFRPDFLQALPDRVYGVMNNETLLAIPFFTFMGLVLERSGMAEDLLETIGQLFGSVRGGIAYAVVFVGALLAATTGVVAASVISMGLISLPIMLRYGYDRRVATGIIAASGTLAQIIPPSLVLIVMADQLGRSVGDMYEGAFIPGIVLSLLYASYIFLVTVFAPKAAPGLPLEAQTLREPETVRHPMMMPLAALSAGGAAYLLAVHWDLFAWSMPAFDKVGLSKLVMQAFWFVVLTAVLFRPFIGIIRTMTMSLYLVVIASTVAGIVTMSFTDVKAGADYIVLTMSVTVALSFVIAVLNRLLRLKLLSKLAEQVVFVMVPPLGLIFLVLGTIFIGVATPTEGGAMGAAGAMLLALAKRRLTFDLTRQATESTAKLTAFVVMILVGARVFSLTFYGVDGHRWVEELLVSLPGGQLGFLIFVNVFVFVLAFFLDFFELAFIVIPLLGPAAEKLGIDLIWFGVIMAVNMQTSFMHPPFGFALFYLRSVAPKVPYIDRVSGKQMAPVTTGQIYWGSVPFVVIQLIMVALVIAFPAMVMHYKGIASTIDPSKVKIDIPQIEMPQIDLGPPKF